MNANLAEYRELASIVCSLLHIRAKLRVLVVENCWQWHSHTHIHIRGAFTPGTIHLAQKDLTRSREAKAALLVHEACHVKLGIGNHTKRFWAYQTNFISREHYSRLYHGSA